MPDFLASLLVFAVIVSMFLYSWNNVVMNQGSFDLEDRMSSEAYYTTTFLVSTPGYPENWTNETVEIPGFASSDNVLDTEKLEEFRKLEYNDQRMLLQAGNYYMVFQDPEENMIELDGEPLEFGEEPQNATTVVPLARNVLLNRSNSFENAEMRYIVWR